MSFIDYVHLVTCFIIAQMIYTYVVDPLLTPLRKAMFFYHFKRNNTEPIVGPEFTSAAPPPQFRHYSYPNIKYVEVRLGTAVLNIHCLQHEGCNAELKRGLVRFQDEQGRSFAYPYYFCKLFNNQDEEVQLFEL